MEKQKQPLTGPTSEELHAAMRFMSTAIMDDVRESLRTSRIGPKGVESAVVAVSSVSAERIAKLLSDYSPDAVKELGRMQLELERRAREQGQTLGPDKLK